jgi:hypothetical protein
MFGVASDSNARRFARPEEFERTLESLRVKQSQLAEAMRELASRRNLMLGTLFALEDYAVASAKLHTIEMKVHRLEGEVKALRSLMTFV